MEGKHKQDIEFRHRAALDLIEKGPALDLGCGDCLFLEMLKKKNVNGMGIDISETKIKRCKEKNINAIKMDFSSEELPFKDEEFPTVIALDVLEHLYQPEKLLREIHRICQKHFILSVPNFSSLPARLQTLAGKVPENNTPKKGHIYWTNLAIISGLLKKNGFRIEKIKMNTFWDSGLMKIFTRTGLKLFPNLFALSFVIRTAKAS